MFGLGGSSGHRFGAGGRGRVIVGGLAGLLLGALVLPAWSALTPLEHARRVLDEAWRGTPFQIERAVLVNRAAAGYGVIQPRADNVFKADEKIYLYIEPVGFAYQSGESLHSFGFDADFLVRTAAGEILGGQRGFARFGFESMHRNREIYVDVEYQFRALPPGEYVVETILHDRVGQAQASTETPIFIEGNLFQRRTMREEPL